MELVVRRFAIRDAGGEVDVDGRAGGGGDGRRRKQDGPVVDGFRPVVVVRGDHAVVAEKVEVAVLGLIHPRVFEHRPALVIHGDAVDFPGEAVGEIEHAAVAVGVNEAGRGVVDRGDVRRVGEHGGAESGEALGGGGLRVFG